MLCVCVYMFVLFSMLCRACRGKIKLLLQRCVCVSVCECPFYAASRTWCKHMSCSWQAELPCVCLCVCVCVCVCVYVCCVDILVFDIRREDFLCSPCGVPYMCAA